MREANQQVSTCQTTQNDIKNIDAFLANFPRVEHSARIEVLFSKALGYMFHLPFYTSVTNDPSKQHKVIWFGENELAPRCAPGNCSDAIVFARHFDVLMEVTQNTGTRQWDREFARVCRHLEDYIKNQKKDRETVYLLLLVKDIHRDTFTSVKPKNREGYNILPITFDNFEKILEVCNLAIGLKHFDVKSLFSRLIRILIDSPNLTHYNRYAKRAVSEWRVNLIDRYRLAYVAIKSYKVFKIEGREHLTASEITTEINTQQDVQSFFKILGRRARKEDVIDSLLTFGFASDAGLPQTDMILSLVSTLEIQERIQEIMESIKLV